ncbi:MAG TPA: CvpA family protein [Chloroflexota bacterium]|nr:CvpA family protein [Chloroflexota bacterium]
MIEFLGAMTALDFLFILIWISAILFGMRSGVVKELFLIASILIGAIGGNTISRPLSRLTGPWAGVSADRGLPVTYFIVTLLITIVLFLVLLVTYRRTRLVRNNYIEGGVGAIVGFFAGLLAVAQLTGMLLVATDQPWAYLDGARENVRLEIQTTPFIPLVAETFPGITGRVAEWMPVSTKDACERCL